VVGVKRIAFEDGEEAFIVVPPGLWIEDSVCTMWSWGVMSVSWIEFFIFGRAS